MPSSAVAPSTRRSWPSWSTPSIHSRRSLYCGRRAASWGRETTSTTTYSPFARCAAGRGAAESLARLNGHAERPRSVGRLDLRLGPGDLDPAIHDLQRQVAQPIPERRIDRAPAGHVELPAVAGALQQVVAQLGLR